MASTTDTKPACLMCLEEPGVHWVGITILIKLQAKGAVEFSGHAIMLDGKRFWLTL